MRIIAFLFLSIVTIRSIQSQSPLNSGTGTSGLDLSSPKEYTIADITVSGARFLDASAIVSISGMKIGNKIRIPGDAITNAVKKLWDQGLLGNVEVNITKIEGENVYLDFYLVERPRLSRFTFKGASKSEQDDIKDKIKLIRGRIITDAALKNTQNTIKKFYAEKGYMNADVKISQAVDTTMNNSVALVINVEKHKKVKIEKIDIQGNEYYTDKKIKQKLKKTKERKPGYFWRRSKFIQNKYEEDKAKMLDFYNENGFRDAKIISDSVFTYHEVAGEESKREKRKRRLEIIIRMEEGRKYYFRNITWTGNYLYDSKYLSSILGIEKGEVYNTKEMEKRLNYNPNGADVSSLYMDDGYLFFHVEPVEILVEGDSIDVEMRVFEGTQATIDKILISGNTKTNDHVIQREIRTYPGDKFSRADLIRSQRELSQLGYFDPEKIEILPKPNPAKGTVDIEYVLTEKPSDQLQLSGGYGGYYGLVGSLGLSFNNFSARNIFRLSTWSPLPSGDGQRLNLSAQANGPTFQSYSISFTEPWLGGRRPNSLTVSVSHSIQNLGAAANSVFGSGFGSSNYYYSGYGTSQGKLQISNFSVSYGRRLRWPDDYFVLSHTASYLIYNLDDYNLGFLTGNVAQTGSFNNVGITNTLSRNSINDPTFPSSGSNISLAVSTTPPYSLLQSGRDFKKETFLEKYKFVEYHKWMLDLSFFHQLLPKLVLNTRSHYGFLGAYNSKLGTGPFERFLLGGNGLAGFNFLLGYDIIGLRGYNNNVVQSQYTGNGNTAFTKQVFELRYSITRSPMASIYVLSFFEAGNAWQDFKQYAPFDLKRSYGVGARIFMPAFGLIGVDYGIPLDGIKGYPGDPGQRFMFMIGQQIR